MNININTTNSYWLDVAQDNQVPSLWLNTGLSEESNSVPSPSDDTTSNITQLDTPPDQHNTGPGIQQNQTRTTRKRNYDITKWSIQEKKTILHCFTYSRFEKWGRRKKIIFEEQIKSSNLQKEKVNSTTTKKLLSIASQIYKYIPATEVNTIKERALEKANLDFNKHHDQGKYKETHWSRKEKWMLIWAMEYAKIKYQNQKERCKEWQRIFHHHCPSKKDITKERLTCQKFNFLKGGSFSQDENTKMKKGIDTMIKKNLCPISSPLPIPEVCQPPPTNQIQTSISLQPYTAPPNPGLKCPPLPKENPPLKEIASQNSSLTTQDQCIQSKHHKQNELPPENIPLDIEQMEIEEQVANRIERTRGMALEDRPKLVQMGMNKAFTTLTMKVNDALSQLVPVKSSLEEINHATYGAAWYIQTKLLPYHQERRKGIYKEKQIEPVWKRKLQQKIEKYRAETSQISGFLLNQSPRKKLRKKIKKIKRKYSIKTTEQLNSRIAENQAEIKALAAQIRNKDKKIDSKKINKLFNRNPRMVYRNLIRDEIKVKSPPTQQEVENFWRPLYEDPKKHREGEWIDTVKEANKGKLKMPALEITQETVRKKVAHFSNFKSPGIDNIPNFWLKKLPVLHEHYAKAFTRILKGEEEPPEWLTIGNTSLLPKNQETHLANKYRPICCLTTTYKWLTGIIADATYDHLAEGDYLEGEQKGCARKKLGTKDQLLVNKTILEDCRKRQRNLSMAWIDYKKAFDSVPHSWILRCLELYNVHEDIRSFLQKQMARWQTRITLNHLEGKIQTTNIRIQRGIFQGDSLSPLLFCLTIDPLSKVLKCCKAGYNLSKGRKKDENKKVNHLLFMDDLKLYAESEKQLVPLIETVKNFTEDICMEFGYEKCAKCTIKKGKKVTAEHLKMDNGHIEDLGEDVAYKYLGIEENVMVEHRQMREKAEKEYISRLKKILKTGLTPKNKITAINQLAIPVISYGFGIIDWPQCYINRLDTKTRKMLTLYKVTYRHQCMDRIYLPRREGGLGLIEINHTYRATILSMGQYINSSRDKTISMVKDHQNKCLSQQTSNTKLAENFNGGQLKNTTENNDNPATLIARKMREEYSKREMETRKEGWRQNKRAGKFMEELNQKYIDKEASLQWLKHGKLPFDEERIITAGQDQGLLTNGFKKMIGIQKNDQCRFCHSAIESPSHLMSGCQILLADGHYTARHNKVCKYLHWKICGEMQLERTQYIWEHEPPPITSNGKVTVFYDKIIQTGRYIKDKAIKPDIVIWNKQKKTALIIDVAVPNDYGLNRAEREKITKYQDLKNDLKTTWALKEINIIPVVVGATGLVKQNLKKYLESIPGKPSCYEIQIAAIKGTCSILKRSLGYKYYL